MSKATGVSKWFSRLKGYGYINPEDDDSNGNDQDLDIHGDDYRNQFYQVHDHKISRIKSNDPRHK
jgi:cold shock CspA family protein